MIGSAPPENVKPPPNYESCNPSAIASLKPALKGELGNLVDVGASKVGIVEATFRRMLAELEDTIAGDQKKTKGLIENALSDAKTKGMSALNGLLFVGKDSFAAEKNNIVQHVDHMHTTMLERVGRLGAVMNGAAVELSSSLHADIEATKASVAAKFGEVRARVKNPTKGFEVAFKKAKHDVANSFDSVKFEAAKEVTNEAFDFTANVKSNALDRKVYSFDMVESRILPVYDDMITSVLGLCSHAVDEAYSVMSNAIDTGIIAQLSGVLNVMAGAIIEINASL
eukprot:gene19678-26363_t